jgi:hypothetical protein
MIPCDVVIQNQVSLNPIVRVEAENPDSNSAVGVRYDNAGRVFEGEAIHMGSWDKGRYGFAVDSIKIG